MSFNWVSVNRFSRLKTLCFPSIVVVAVWALVALAARSPVDWRAIDPRGATRDVGWASPATAEQPTSGGGGRSPADGARDALPSDISDAAAAVDRLFERSWREEGAAPADCADNLQILRRLFLALCGTIPSLEEIREFESDADPARLDRWTARLLADNRFADYFSERLARSFVGAEIGQFVIFRRDRFVDWLRQQLAKNTPYDQLVRQMISETGLWTDRPAANFVTAAVADGNLDENKLAGRTARAFLGQRIDCAQCHDHPFAEWKQAQFQGLAALFGQTRTALVGVEDKTNRRYEVEDRKTLQKRVVEPDVPFHPEWLPRSGTRRERLAAWVTHPRNRRFERATANRIWGLLFGKPYHSPVDDLPDPPDQGNDLLDLIGGDFRAHGCDLRRMIRVAAASRPFRLDSAKSESGAGSVQQLSSSAVSGRAADWATFPMTRLRPEQLIGSILQASSLRTIDQNSHLFVRAQRFFQEKDFVKEYGDLGENELDEKAGTISQALLRMNGKLAADALRAAPLNATSRIAVFAGSDATCLETCYLVALTRRPCQAEADHFLPQLAAAKQKSRAQVVEDLFWSLFNSPEFSWNH